MRKQKDDLTAPQDESKPRPLDYLPHDPRFDDLRRLMVANAMRRAAQMEMFREAHNG